MTAVASGARARGQAMVEFVCVLVPLLLLILGTIQFGLIYKAKLTLNYAAFETARAGALNGARMLFMENAFARAMAPLYTNSFWDQGTSMDDCTSRYVLDLDADAGPDVAGDMDIDHVECGRGWVRRQIANERVRIVLVNPSTASFDDFGVSFDLVREYHPSTDGHLSGTRVIPNDNLMYRSARPGPSSLQSIHDANLIKVHVSYCYDLIVPLVADVIGELMTRPPTDIDTLDYEVGGGVVNEWGFGPLSSGTFGRMCADSGGIPLYATSVMRMHSAAVEEAVSCVGYCS